MCYRSHMYCNRCGSDKHFAAQCDRVVLSDQTKKALVDAYTKTKKHDKKDRYCSECGTNLDARDKARKRRREYMKRYRKK
jgi:hypothetical protein